MMKCSKIILEKRNNNKNGKIDSASNKENQTLWFTTKYHGYSYKLSARCKKIQPSVSEAQLTITTLIFPENFSYNTGSSLDRWSRKTPNLLSSKRRNFTPRKHILFDEYDDDDDNDVIKFDYPMEEFFDVQEIVEETKDSENNNDYFVASDIEELLLKSQRIKEELNDDALETGKKQNNCAVKKKREKLRRKTIRYSLSKPPSPQTEQIIRVDVTSSVSVEDVSAEESIISVKKDDFKKNLQSNSTEHVANEEEEENFIIVKCRQLALAQKKIIPT